MKFKASGVLLAAVMLTACGGSDNSNDTVSANVAIAAELKGPESEPALTPVTIANGDSVELNSLISGNLAQENDEINISFDAEENGLVALVLSSSASDFDLQVSSSLGGASFTGENDGSREVILFEAEKSLRYFITVDSYKSSGDFTLKLVEANRQSLELTENEYAVSIKENSDYKCTLVEYSEEENYILFVSWRNGYIKAPGGEKYQFSSADGNSVTVKINESESGESFNYSLTDTIRFAVNEQTGAIDGTKTGSFTYTEKGDGNSCSYNSELTGSILL